MKKIMLSGVFLIMLVGCAGTSAKMNIPYENASGKILVYSLWSNVEINHKAFFILNDRLKTKLGSEGLLTPIPEFATVEVDITITNYYMRHGAARALAGIMAGTDNIRSTVVVRDKNTGSVLGDFTVESTNPTALWTSKGMIQEHADKIVSILKNGSPS